MTASPFCAICTSEVGPFRERALGRNGAMVLVCAPCRGEHPRSGRYSFGGGQPAQVGTYSSLEGNRRNRRGR